MEGMEQDLKRTMEWLKVIWQAFLKWLDGQVHLPPPPPEPPGDKEALLLAMMLAIKKHEGFYDGSRSKRNNNPGNFKFSSVGYLPKYEPVRKDKDGFAIFPFYDVGWMYLRNHILVKAKKHPEWTLKQFFNEYAPPVENDTVRYASVVAAAMGVSPYTWQLKNLL